MRLHYFVLLFPFVLVALYHHISYTSLHFANAPHPSMGARRRGGFVGGNMMRRRAAAAEPEPPAQQPEPPAQQPEAHQPEPPQREPKKPRPLHEIDADHPAPADRAAAVRPPAHAAAAAAVAAPTPLGADEPKSAQQAHRLRDAARAAHPAGGGEAAPVAAGADVSRSYPPPTLSAKKLLDGSQNWLPVPDAEGDAPSDLRWRAAVRPGEPCPAGRRPYHTILTAQASLYQEWQTKIFYYHFRKAQRHMGPCGEMTGFTRLLASANGQPDGLMDSMPTVTVAQLGHDKTRGFQVINRPWTMDQFLKRPDEWNARIKEEYVYIAETDHLIIREIPNRATPKLGVAFFFPYMSPVPAEQSRVVKRYYDGDHLSVQPIGPSPAILHVDMLKKVTPLWYDLSVQLKADRDADRAFGWVLEMWGYSLAAARVGLKHYVWQQLQIEPSATWHQNVTSENPFIYHYTFGVEYTSDGVPIAGAVGEWSLDKRHYFGAYPASPLERPPECAEECAWVWWGMFNEATAGMEKAVNLKWAPDGRMGGNTRSFGRNRGGGGAALADSALGRALPRTGPWEVDGKGPILFFTAGRLSSPWGLGSWSVAGETTVKISLCSPDTALTFDSASAPTKFTFTGRRAMGVGGSEGAGVLGSSAAGPKGFTSDADADHPAVKRVMGAGPWAWAGITPMAFLGGGRLHSPWGPGTYAPVAGTTDSLYVNFVGSKHRVTLDGCYKFHSVRETDGEKVDGWVQMGQQARGSGCPF